MYVLGLTVLGSSLYADYFTFDYWWKQLHNYILFISDAGVEDATFCNKKKVVKRLSLYYCYFTIFHSLPRSMDTPLSTPSVPPHHSH